MPRIRTAMVNYSTQTFDLLDENEEEGCNCNGQGSNDDDKTTTMRMRGRRRMVNWQEELSSMST